MLQDVGVFGRDDAVAEVELTRETAHQFEDVGTEQEGGVVLGVGDGFAVDDIDFDELLKDGAVVDDGFGWFGRGFGLGGCGFEGVNELKGFAEFLLGAGGVFFEELKLSLGGSIPVRHGEAGGMEIELELLEEGGGAAAEPVGVDEVLAEGEEGEGGAGECFGPGEFEIEEVLVLFVGQESLHF